MRWVWLGAAFFGLSGCSCSGSVDTQGAYCAQHPEVAICHQTCSASMACPGGFYCLGTTCSADCSTTGPACGTGQVCTADGRCAPGGTCNPTTGTGCPVGQVCNAGGVCESPGFDASLPDGQVGLDNTCASFTLNGTRMPPNVILVVDRSRSMITNDFGTTGMTRWDVLYNTLMNGPDGLVTRLQMSVRFGLALFTSVRDGICPEIIEVLPPALNARNAIDTVYAANPPGFATPTGASLDQIVMDLDAMTLPPGPTILLLATDGEPNTCADPMDMAGGMTQAIAAAGRANGAGYPVYAIGVGNDVGQGNLSMISQAGGGGDAYSVNDPTSLAASLEAIVGTVVSCTVTLNGRIDPANACQGTVRLGTTVIPCNDPNGWVAIDQSHIQLQGTACDMLTAAGGGLTGVFPCDVILI